MTDTAKRPERMLWCAAFVFALFILGIGWMSSTAQKAYEQRRKQVYDACVADGKPSYYCQALARQATR